ncbi:baseplate J/gp47 family protein [Metasolibacillus meyeri]|uniref:Baseplate J/gp47 family protein n=1 Tax=Metasolibacillus meyeri TaxID=1071052 RepID=A0AAW9NRJ2_9BACL|nr:baseplate J/gp47 family protein [Metasolibacillus meyeri]MEC1178550.1 baseplate J/gp47 family protein [Metasolibacillus meyeri]
MLEYLEAQTFEKCLAELLERVPDDVDKREGSIIYDALAPTAIKLAETYWDMAILYRRTFAATADGIDLEKRVNESGVERKQAGKAIRRALFTDRSGQPLLVNMNNLYRLDDLVYRVTEYIAPGEYKVEAQSAGAIGNRDYGDLLPLEADNRLGKAVLSDVIVPGEDEETDEALYQRYLEHIREPPFGGNRADYRQRVRAIQGVGGVRLRRAPQGGGTVKVIIIDSDFNAPTSAFVDYVQSIIDPIDQPGDGLGTAPIGHTVTVEGVGTIEVTVECDLILNGVTLGQIEPQITENLYAYFAELRTNWHKDLDINVRITHIESRILEIEGVEDIASTLLNGLPNNINLIEEIPLISSIDMKEVSG